MNVLGSIYWLTARRLMPNRTRRWAEVNTHIDGKMFDHYLLPPYFNYPRDKPNYESALVSGLRGNISPGDRVTIIGGGYGITTVIASRLAGTRGKVQVFEGSAQQVSICEQVLKRNQIPNNVKVTNTIVGENIAVYDQDGNDAQILNPQDLDACNFLEMDCEGSEIGILKDMVIRPRVILVETHGFLGAPTTEVKKLLMDKGYSVEELGVAEIDLAATCIKNDIMVLLGRKVNAD